MFWKLVDSLRIIQHPPLRLRIMLGVFVLVLDGVKNDDYDYDDQDDDYDDQDDD